MAASPEMPQLWSSEANKAVQAVKTSQWKEATQLVERSRANRDDLEKLLKEYLWLQEVRIREQCDAHDGREETDPVLDEEDKDCLKGNAQLLSLVTFAEGLRNPEFIKTQKWASLLLPLEPEGEGVVSKIESFSFVRIRCFDEHHAVVFCRSKPVRYATQVAALLVLKWTGTEWTYSDSKLFHAYGKDALISFEDAEYSKWGKSDSTTNRSRVGTSYIITQWEGGAEAQHFASTYRLNPKSGKLDTIPVPTVTKKIVSEKTTE
jgi:hypothetical protein